MPWRHRLHARRRAWSAPARRVSPPSGAGSSRSRICDRPPGVVDRLAVAGPADRRRPPPGATRRRRRTVARRPRGGTPAARAARRRWSWRRRRPRGGPSDRPSAATRRPSRRPARWRSGSARRRRRSTSAADHRRRCRRRRRRRIVGDVADLAGVERRAEHGQALGQARAGPRRSSDDISESYRWIGTVLVPRRRGRARRCVSACTCNGTPPERSAISLSVSSRSRRAPATSAAICRDAARSSGPRTMRATTSPAISTGVGGARRDDHAGRWRGARAGRRGGRASTGRRLSTSSTTSTGSPSPQRSPRAATIGARARLVAGVEQLRQHRPQRVQRRRAVATVAEQPHGRPRSRCARRSARRPPTCRSRPGR